MKNNLLTLVLLLTAFLASAQSSNNDWQFYPNQPDIIDLSLDGTDIWAASSKEGLYKVDITTNEVQFLDRINAELPTNHWRKVYKIPNGDLWLTTYQGLIQYDGSNWQTHTDSLIPYISQIQEMTNDADGNLLIVSYLGVIKYDGTTWTKPLTFQPGLWSNRPYRFAKSNNGNVWTYDAQNLYELVDNEWLIHTFETPLVGGSYYIRDIEVDSQNHVWWTTNLKELVQYDGTNFTAITEAPTFDNDWYDITFDANDNLWMRSQSCRSLYKFDGTDFSIFDFDDLGLGEQFGCGRDIPIDENGQLWFEHKGAIHSIDLATWTTSNNIDLSQTPLVSAGDIVIDANNTKWVLEGKRLLSFNHAPNFDSWTIYDTSNSPIVEGEYLLKMMLGSDGAIWLLTTTNLLKLQNNTWQTIPLETPLETYSGSKNLIEDSNGHIWIIAQKNQLVRYDGDAWTYYDFELEDDPNVTIEQLVAFAIDQNEELWVASDLGRVLKFNGTAWTEELNITSVSEFPIAYSYCTYTEVIQLLFDQNNNLWLTGLQGIARYDGSTLQDWNFSELNLTMCATNKLVLGQNGQVYVATNGGLLRYTDNNEWEEYNSENTVLSSNNTYGFAIDEWGNKWMVTGSGIEVFNNGGIIDAVAENTNSLQASIRLKNYPNPFNDSIILETESVQTIKGQINIYDNTGKQVIQVYDGSLVAGKHQFTVDGSTLMPGIYFCVMEQAGKTVSAKITKF